MNQSKFKAAIFDMDGVLSDTQVFHSAAEHEILKEHGVEMTPEEIEFRYAGTSLPHLFSDAFERGGKKMPELKTLIAEKRKRMQNTMHGKVISVPGTKEFIEKLDMPKAVASASGLDLIENILTELGFKKYFSAITSATEVEKGKPAPDVFLLAAQRLGVGPEDCFVVEDAVSGMTAAKAAGMACVGLVRADIDHGQYPADIVVNDLRKVPEEFF